MRDVAEAQTMSAAIQCDSDSFPAFLDPSSGELHYHDGIIRLPVQLNRFLLMLAAAGGEIVSPEAMQPLFRGYAAHTEVEARRRQMLRRLRSRIEPAGLAVETCNGFGYRLRGEVRVKTV
jgi:DNA-binding response OmpR family regulator